MEDVLVPTGAQPFTRLMLPRGEGDVKYFGGVRHGLLSTADDGDRLPLHPPAWESVRQIPRRVRARNSQTEL